MRTEEETNKWFADLVDCLKAAECASEGAWSLLTAGRTKEGAFFIEITWPDGELPFSHTVTYMDAATTKQSAADMSIALIKRFYAACEEGETSRLKQNDAVNGLIDMITSNTVLLQRLATGDSDVVSRVHRRRLTVKIKSQLRILKWALDQALDESIW